MEQIRRPFKELTTNIKNVPVLRSSSEGLEFLPADQHACREISMRLVSTYYKAQFGQPILCSLHKPDHVKKEVYAAEVNAHFEFFSLKGSEGQETTITVDHNVKAPLIGNGFVHSNERAISVTRHTTTNICPTSPPMEPMCEPVSAGVSRALSPCRMLTD